MRADWFTIVGSSETLSTAGIYQWLVDGSPIYTGRALNPRSRLGQYDRNVRRLEEGASYRRGNADGFRLIHRRLHEAAAAGANIQFRVVENCDRAALNAREQHHHRQMSAGSQPAVSLDQLLAAVGRLVFYWSSLEQGLADEIQDARRRLGQEQNRVTGSIADRLTIWRDLCSCLLDYRDRQALVAAVCDQALELRRVRNLIVHGLDRVDSAPADGPALVRCLVGGYADPTGKTVTFTIHDLENFSQAMDACRRAFKNLDAFNYRLG